MTDYPDTKSVYAYEYLEKRPITDFRETAEQPISPRALQHKVGHWYGGMNVLRISLFGISREADYGKFQSRQEPKNS